MDKRMRALQEQIYNCAQAHIEDASTEELGEAIDMIKDLGEAIYYEQKTKLINKELECMEEEEIAEKYLRHRDMDREYGRMYYSGDKTRYPQPHMIEPYPRKRISGELERDYEEPYRIEMRDSREGRSPISRRNYMESKEMHKDKTTKINDLEKYMQELTEDIVEMITDATPEEKQVLDRKVTALASKISSLNV